MPYSNKISIKIIDTKGSLNNNLELLFIPVNIISVITVNKLELRPFVFLRDIMIIGRSDCASIYDILPKIKP